jgi:hypothetical protein
MRPNPARPARPDGTCPHGTGSPLDHEQGQRTEDLIALRRGHPAEPQSATQVKPSIDTAERPIRTLGHRLGAIGLTLMMVPVIGILVCLTVSRTAMADDVNQTLALAAYTTFSAAGAILAGLFFQERLQRYPRAALRQVMTRDAERVAQFDRLIAAAEAGAANLRAVEDRLADIEEAIGKIPDYGAGVIDGATMRQSVLGEGTDRH